MHGHLSRGNAAPYSSIYINLFLVTALP
uniref:Uncharacterized protein n=1 Tax=Arundo donax TaxID=35708 RepID=A0A0A8ZYM4_ARUDO